MGPIFTAYPTYNNAHVCPDQYNRYMKGFKNQFTLFTHNNTTGLGICFISL